MRKPHAPISVEKFLEKHEELSASYLKKKKNKKTPNCSNIQAVCVSVCGTCSVDGEENYGDVGSKEICELELKSHKKLANRTGISQEVGLSF